MLAAFDALQVSDLPPVQFSAIAPAEGPLATELEKRHISIHPFADGRAASNTSGRAPLSELRQRVTDIVEFVKPDLLHANSLSAARIAGPVCKALRIASLGHLRDIIRLNRTAIDDLSCHHRLIAVSQATADFHRHQGFARNQVSVCYNGVDTRQFRPRPSTGSVHRDLGIDDHGRLVANIGQICMRKGQDVFLEAAGVVARRRRNVHFLVVGERYSRKQEAVDYERRLHAKANTPVLAQRVHFVGWREGMPQFLNDIDILAHTANQEPFGRVLLEAAASGTPVVATDVGGTLEIFGSHTGDGPGTAALVAPKNVNEVAAALERLLEHPDHAVAMAGRARKRIANLFSIENAAEHLLWHYRDVLRESNGRLAC